MKHQDTPAAIDSLARFWERNQRTMPVVGLALVLVLVATAWLLRERIDALEVAGYPGVFLLNFIGAVSIVLPVPGILSVCGLSVALNPAILGLLGGLGEFLGEWSGYVVGYGGNSLFDRVPIYRRLRPVISRWMRRRGTLVLIIVSAIPNPIFDLVGIAAGTVQFPFRRFMVIVFFGKIFKGLLVAYTCHYGFTVLPWVS